MIHLVTYATHNQGMLQTLLKNKFGIKVNLLGWNTKWHNFMDKYKGVLSFCESVSNQHMIIFLDGFDSEIKKNPRNILSVFNKMKCDILVSKEPTSIPYVKQKVFGVCNNGKTANSGLYMGKNEKVKTFLKELLRENTSDDQVALNNICKTSQLNIKVDEGSRIFHNGKSKNNAYFVSYPAGENENVIYKLGRYYRGIFEYGHYFVCEICIIVLMIVILRKLYKKYSF